LLRDGLPGLLDSTGQMTEGVWSARQPSDARPGGVHGAGYPTASADAFRDWINSAGGTSYDSIIGSVGGGNHFAEVQYVSAVHHRQAAHAWGFRLGQVVLMVHSGSLSLTCSVAGATPEPWPAPATARGAGFLAVRRPEGRRPSWMPSCASSVWSPRSIIVTPASPAGPT
jgi:hypothetical protein